MKLRGSGVVVGLAIGFAAFTCGGERAATAAPRNPASQDADVPRGPRVRVTFKDAFGFAHAVDAEVASSTDARAQGLMWRTSLANGKGMFFAFPRPSQLRFWMKNTLIPLDMIFMDAALKIVGIEEGCTPHDETARGPTQPAQFVLEVPAGWAAAANLKPGLVADVVGLRAITVTD